MDSPAGAHNQDFRTIPGLWGEIGGLRVLDAGCGQGLYTNELARRGARPVGLELSLEDARRAKLSAATAGIFWVCGDATRLPFRSEVFDLVVSVEVLTHLPPPARAGALQEFQRTLRPGGRVFVTLHNQTRLQLSHWLRWRPAQPRYSTSHLDVWPTAPGEVETPAGLRPLAPVRYLNYHSRFTHRFYLRHPLGARLLIWGENALSRLPVLRRLAITFLLRLGK